MRIAVAGSGATAALAAAAARQRNHVVVEFDVEQRPATRHALAGAHAAVVVPNPEHAVSAWR